MLRRLIFENWAILCTLIAFTTALSIFLYIAYRALRMKRSDATRIANIPLEEEKKVLANRGDHPSERVQASEQAVAEGRAEQAKRSEKSNDGDK